MATRSNKGMAQHTSTSSSDMTCLGLILLMALQMQGQSGAQPQKALWQSYRCPSPSVVPLHVSGQDKSVLVLKQHEVSQQIVVCHPGTGAPSDFVPNVTSTHESKCRLSTGFKHGHVRALCCSSQQAYIGKG